MGKMKTIHKIAKYVFDKTGIMPEPQHSLYKDFGLDSIDIIEYCMELEKEYNIQFSEKELHNIETFKQFYDLTYNKIYESKNK